MWRHVGRNDESIDKILDNNSFGGMYRMVVKFSKQYNLLSMKYFYWKACFIKLNKK